MIIILMIHGNCPGVFRCLDRYVSLFWGEGGRARDEGSLIIAFLFMHSYYYFLFLLLLFSSPRPFLLLFRLLLFLPQAELFVACLLIDGYMQLPSSRYRRGRGKEGGKGGREGGKARHNGEMERGNGGVKEEGKRRMKERGRRIMIDEDNKVTP